MSKLDELIQKLCPNGVEFYPLWKCVYFGKRFNGVEKHKQEKVLTFSHVSAEQLKNMKCGGEVKLLSTGKFEGYTTKEVAYEFLNEGEVISFPSGGSAALKYYYGYFVDSGNILCQSANTKKNNLKFIYHYLLKNIILIESYYRGSGVKHPEMSKIIEMKIPVPPLEVQDEIVRILDQFTLLTVELTSELTARKQQYEYYRKELLSFDNNVKRLKIKDVFTRLKGTPITAGKMKEIEDINGEVKIFAGGKTQIFAKEIDIPNANITRVPAVLVQSRGVIDFIYYDKPFTFKNEMWAYTCKNNTTLKFLYYVLKENVNHFRESSSGMGAMPQISLAVTEDFEISLPSLEEQQRIVDILDKFDTYCNDLTQGLPAEIELRKQQYEYYRDKLLTFKELK